jgi:fatty-acyl-CoA synthase
LARYKVPREVVFLEELPRNPTGKVLKRELREMEVDGADAKAGENDEKGATGGDDDKTAVGGDEGKAGAE